MNARKKTTYTLGLDLGSQSIGWAICPCDENGKIVSTEDLGVRIFDDGREAKSHEPLAVGRRLAKQTARRRKRAFMRRQALFNFLRGENLLPADPQDSRKLAECDPYALRAKATKIKIERHEIGRVLLHINKRRGFKSSRKEAQSEDKEVQGMKKGIANLQAKTKNQTLGEILHDKRQKNWRKPVRFRPQTSGSTNHWEIYPERSMYEEEIRAIFKKQAEFYPDLNEEKLKKALHIIINQRPLKKPKVGSCRFLTDESRAPLALPSQQRFRIFQEINNLELRQNLSFRFLTKEERKLIAEQLLITAKETNLLNKKGELTFSKIKTKILKDSSAFLNLEEMGRKNLQGDLAAQALSKDECFGKKWFDLSLEDQDRIVLKLIGAEDKELQDEDDAVHAWLVSEWGLNDNHAQACLNAKLPDGYGRLGRTALGKILPYLEKGFIYSEAVAESGLKDPLANIKNRSELPYYGEILENYTMPHPSHGKHGVPDIPEVKFGRIPNPTVHIGLNQLRRVVNAIIHKYGPPEVIRIELARDFAFSAEQTNKLKKKQTENRKRNEIAREAVEKAGHDASKRENIVRYKLWEELHSDPLQRFCPFSGKIISIENLFSSEIEVEHILPFAQTFDDSFNNKTLCFRDWNRKKGNATPFEAFGSQDTYENMLERVKELKNPGKIWRFREGAMERFMKENPDLIARTLNDTRYLSRAAKAYLQAICPKVEPIRGAMTSSLRHFWGLNKILGDSEKKDRGEHRHHAIDAFVVAASSRSFLREFQKRTEENKYQNPSKNPLRLKNFPEPYFGFTPKVLEDKAACILVSHRQDQLKPQKPGEKRSNTPGALHKETFYGLEAETPTDLILKIRRPVTTLKQSDCENIASPRLRKYFLTQAELFTDASEWKNFLSDLEESGRIRRLRMLEKTSKDTVTPFKARDGNSYRFAKTGGNAWSDIIETKDKKGKAKWVSVVTTLFEAATLSTQEPLWKKEYPAARLVCRLAINDTVALLGTDKKWRLFRVKRIRRDDGRVYVRDIRIANEDGDQRSIALGASRMLRENLTKVAIGPMGDLRAPANIRNNLYVGPIYTDTK